MQKRPQAPLRGVGQHRPEHGPGRRVAAGLFPWAVARPQVHRHAGQRVPLPVLLPPAPLVPPVPPAPEVPEPIVPVPVVPVPVVPVVPEVAPELLVPVDVLSVPVPVVPVLEPVVPVPLPVVPEAPMLPEPVAPPVVPVVPVVDELLPVPEPMPEDAGLVELPGALVPEGVSLRLQALSPATPTNKAVTTRGRHELVFIKIPSRCCKNPASPWRRLRV